MIFSSLLFVFWFLPIVLCVYFLLRPKYRNYWLIIASLFFYAWGEFAYSIVLFLSITANYFFAILIDQNSNPKLRKLWLILALIFNIGLLGYFKYWNLILASILNILPQLNLNNATIYLPIGISFFTFQAITYIVDVYRGKHKCLSNILDLVLYISFFPHLIAGPIITFSQFATQLNARIVTLDGFVYGVCRFIVGLAKKVLIANSMAQIADPIFNATNISADVAWLGIVAYSLQIYFDFSGYSDMAIGMFRMFGFTFPENFNYPYISKSVKEFWKRWHISLTSWFREYIYIPLGGSRTHYMRSYLNLLAVFLLTGIWHGASWNFLFWGMYFGVFSLLERAISKIPLLNGNNSKDSQGKISIFLRTYINYISSFSASTIVLSILGHTYLLLVVIMGWVFFRLDNFASIQSYLGYMIGSHGMSNFIHPVSDYLNREQLIFLILGVIFSTPVYRVFQDKIDSRQDLLSSLCMGIILNIYYLGLFILSVAYLLVETHKPFIYFRF